MSDMKIKCPQCKTPLLVGPHSLRLDREQSATDAKDKEIERLRIALRAIVVLGKGGTGLATPSMLAVISDVALKGGSDE